MQSSRGTPPGHPSVYSGVPFWGCLVHRGVRYLRLRLGSGSQYLYKKSTDKFWLCMRSGVFVNDMEMACCGRLKCVCVCTCVSLQGVCLDKVGGNRVKPEALIPWCPSGPAKEKSKQNGPVFNFADSCSSSCVCFAVQCLKSKIAFWTLDHFITTNVWNSLWVHLNC